jgi:hypothetical protein
MQNIDKHLDKAKDFYNANNDDPRAFKHLWYAVSALHEREDRRAKFANRLLAETMFAVVRLEIAQGTDQIINNALAVKREKTGSGTGEFAINTTATLVMLAGNVLSGGGMSLLGNLLVAAGEMGKAAAKNDAAGLAKGVVKLAASGTTAGMSGSKGFADQSFAFSDKKDLKDGKAEVRNEAEGVGAIIAIAGEGAADLVVGLYERTAEPEAPKESNQPVRKRTFFVQHGAGGTHAITKDVQEAIQAAYGETLNLIAQELATIGRSDGKHTLGKSSIIGQIVDSPLDPTAKLHPVTEAVIKRAIEILSSTGGKTYQALTGGSGVFGRESVLQEAQREVKRAYGFMLDGGTLIGVDALRAKLKP